MDETSNNSSFVLLIVEYNKKINSGQMKVIQLLAVLIFLAGFGYISYYILMDFSDITPELKEEVIRNACATNELQGDECLKYVESQLY